MCLLTLGYNGILASKVVIMIISTALTQGNVLDTLQASLSGPFPPKSAVIHSYATEAAFFNSAHLSTDAVGAFQQNLVLIRLWKQRSV